MLVKLFSEEHKKNISQSKLGKPSPFKSKIPLDKSKKKISDSKIGKPNPHNKEWNKKIGDSQRGPKSFNYGKTTEERNHKLDCKCYACVAKRGGVKGKLNPSYKGGMTDLHVLIRECAEYMKWRKSVFVRDNFTCQKCKLKSGNIEAHHKKTFSNLYNEFLENFCIGFGWYGQYYVKSDKFILLEIARTWKPFWDVDNGQTLCEECHIEYHKINESGV